MRSADQAGGIHLDSAFVRIGTTSGPLDALHIFGSVARGDDRDGSDLDVLVDLAHGTSLFDMAGIQLEPEDLLGVEVDLVPNRSLKERIRARVERDAVAL